jgi:hypothetical protein
MRTHISMELPAEKITIIKTVQVIKDPSKHFNQNETSADITNCILKI